MNPFAREYEEAVLRFHKAQKDHPTIKHGPEPDPKDYGFKSETDLWQAKQIRARVVRELNRIN